MMFMRRHKSHLLHQVREFFWPKSGWRRAGRYLGYRVMRLHGTPYSIAAGFACGAAASFTPFVGFHFMLAALCAWLIGGHILASAIGTAVGNPWTFPFIWAWLLRFGEWMLGGEMGNHLADEISMSYIFNNFWHVMFPMIIGSLPTAPVVWFVTYQPLRRVVASYQALRNHRLQRRRK